VAEGNQQKLAKHIITLLVETHLNLALHRKQHDVGWNNETQLQEKTG